MRRLILLLIVWLQKLTYKGTYLDDVNKKLIRPVPKLIIDGKQYYEFVQVADMPQNRFVHYMDFREESNMGVTRELLNAYLDDIEKANDAGEHSRVGSRVYMLRDTINNCTPIEVLYNMASLLYFTDDEDISCYDLDYNQDKIRKFKQLQDKSFFFADTAGAKLEGYWKIITQRYRALFKAQPGQAKRLQADAYRRLRIRNRESFDSVVYHYCKGDELQAERVKRKTSEEFYSWLHRAFKHSKKDK